ncbi:hypothetical protein, partial [Salmonella sp. M265]|uniref:hypothetical protein n=1 Tax=Salmonella sp. M265 TaxID=3240301 RepID=UPI00352B5A47
LAEFGRCRWDRSHATGARYAASGTQRAAGLLGLGPLADVGAAQRRTGADTAQRPADFLVGRGHAGDLRRLATRRDQQRAQRHAQYRPTTPGMVES